LCHQPTTYNPTTQNWQLATGNPLDFYTSLLIGVFLGFVFGVGCALAVMYSIYMGGYRAAVKDTQLPTPPERLTTARAKLRAASKPD
jgi:hypothetical protein